MGHDPSLKSWARSEGPETPWQRLLVHSAQNIERLAERQGFGPARLYLNVVYSIADSGEQMGEAIACGLCGHEDIGEDRQLADAIGRATMCAAVYGLTLREALDLFGAP